MPEFKRPEWSVLNLSSKYIQTDLTEADISFLCNFLAPNEIDDLRAYHRSFVLWKKLSSVPGLIEKKQWSRNLATPNPGNTEPRKKQPKKFTEILKEVQSKVKEPRGKDPEVPSKLAADNPTPPKANAPPQEDKALKYTTEEKSHASFPKTGESTVPSDTYPSLFLDAEAPAGLFDSPSTPSLSGKQPKKVVTHQMFVEFLDIDLGLIPVGQVKWPFLRLQKKLEIKEKVQRISVRFNNERFLLNATVEEFSHEKQLHPIRLKESDEFEKLKTQFNTSIKT
jgi:hypothetical protein